MAVKDARNVITVVYGNKLAAERIAIAMLEKDLLARKIPGGFEVHRECLSVESKATERHALASGCLRDLDCRRIFDDGITVLVRLFGIIELASTNLRGRFYRDERRIGIRDDEQGTCRAVGPGSSPSGRSMHTNERNILKKSDSALNRIPSFNRLHKQGGSA